MGNHHKEITRTRQSGTEVTDTTQFDDPGQARIDAIRRIVEQWQYAKVDGCTIDAFTASAVIQVYDAISEDAKCRMRNMSVPRMVDITWKVIDKTSPK